MLISKNVNCNFLSRIEFLLGNQKKHNWGKERGFSPGTIDRLFKGQIPGHEVLTAISMFDNASITWLISGSGSPFLVVATSQDDEFAEQLQDHLLADHEIHIFNNPSIKTTAIVLSRRSTYTYKDKTIQFTDIKIITGFIGIITRQFLKECKEHHKTENLIVSEFCLHRISKGMASIMDIFNFMNDAVIKTIDFDEVPAHTIDRRRLPQIETLDEKKLLTGFREIGDDDKKTILNLVDSLKNK